MKLRIFPSYYLGLRAHYRIIARYGIGASVLHCYKNGMSSIELNLSLIKLSR
jgi:hypothetical protein